MVLVAWYTKEAFFKALDIPALDILALDIPALVIPALVIPGQMGVLDF